MTSATHLVLVGAKAEVLDGLTGVLGTTEENDTRASGSTHGELIEGQALSAGLLDASTSGGGEAQGADGHLGHLVEAGVIGDCGDDGSDLALVRLGRVLIRGHGDDLAQADGRAVDFACVIPIRDWPAYFLISCIPTHSCVDDGGRSG